MSSLSITFSADGTTLYVADDDGIWQFKTVASLAGSTSGSLIGLNDLRSLGVPYDGQGSAVAVIDTGVDAFSAPFRGRVATGHERLHRRPRQRRHRGLRHRRRDHRTGGGTGGRRRRQH